MLPKLLLVEDDPFVSALTDAFLKQRFSMVIANTAKAALEAFSQNRFDLVLMDLGLPDEDGLVVARQMKARNKDQAIIFLTSRDTKEDMIAGLELGGDDYIVKPFDPDVLLARISAVLRRTTGASADVHTIHIQTGQDSLELDVQRRIINVKDKGELNLTRAEFDVIRTLAQADGRVLSRGFLMDAIVSDPSRDVDERVVDALVSKIRRKASALGLSSSPIETVRGLGYRVVSG